MALIECKECGRSISDQAAACPNCGVPLRAAPVAQPTIVTAPKSRSLAILLALFLGGIGMHKFYLNRPGMGFLYLLFCWTFIPLIVALLEGLYYLTMSDEEFQSEYGG